MVVGLGSFTPIVFVPCFRRVCFHRLFLGLVVRVVLLVRVVFLVARCNCCVLLYVPFVAFLVCVFLGIPPIVSAASAVNALPLGLPLAIVVPVGFSRPRLSSLIAVAVAWSLAIPLAMNLGIALFMRSFLPLPDMRIYWLTSKPPEISIRKVIR